MFFAGSTTTKMFSLETVRSFETAVGEGIPDNPKVLDMLGFVADFLRNIQLETSSSDWLEVYAKLFSILTTQGAQR